MKSSFRKRGLYNYLSSLIVVVVNKVAGMHIGNFMITP